MGVPPEMDVYFATVQQAAGRLESWRRDERPGILLTGDIETMRRLVDLSNGIRAINLGGIHHRAGRLERLRYIYLTPEEERVLRSLDSRGVAISAQDVPSARPLPLSELLVGDAAQKRGIAQKP